jgi:hypothetical protein
MSRLSVSFRALALVLCAGPVTGCVEQAAFNPVEGPLAAQRPTPVYMANVNDPGPGQLTVRLENGEVFKGAWLHLGPQVDATPSTAFPSLGPDLTSDWDYVYGAGYFRAHVLGSRSYTRAFLVGSAGSTAVVEVFFDEHDQCGQKHGVARDSHDNVYKVTVFGICLSGAVSNTGSTAVDNTGPTLVIPAAGGPPVMAIPVGGGLYQPTTGGAPVPGTPVP